MDEERMWKCRHAVTPPPEPDRVQGCSSEGLTVSDEQSFLRSPQPHFKALRPALQG